MDLELARTFLAVVDEGSFLAAAERLHVTQAAVSRRIKTLEGHLGSVLFVRNKSGATMTRGGHAFQRHAVSLLRTFEQARHELDAPGRFQASLAVGARFGLWEQLLVKWLGSVRDYDPQLRVRAQVGFEEGLMHHLVEGALDIGVMYTPQSRPGLRVEKLMDEQLVLVKTPGVSDEPSHPDSGYVYVDWGPEFRARHTQAFPDFAGTGINVDIGWIGLQHLRLHGGSGYFPQRLVNTELTRGDLLVVDGAPGFAIPVYAVYHLDSQLDALAPAMSLLRETIASLPPGSCETAAC